MVLDDLGVESLWEAKFSAPVQTGYNGCRVFI
jgi:hypothetical protein